MTVSTQQEADQSRNAARPGDGIKRGLRTTVTVAGLFAVYCLYTAVVGPLTRPQELANRLSPGAAAPEIKPQPLARRMAREHLSDEDWVAEAKYQLQRGEETFIYFHSQRRIDDDKRNKMRVQPFAMVWRDPRSNNGAAYTMTCNSAVIEFETKVQFEMSGRIINGELNGKVRITGPDGLLVTGQNVLFEEKALRLYSDYPIEFQYGPRPGEFEQVRGRAGRLDVTLEETTESILGRDMPRIGGLSQIQLSKDVGLSMVMDDGGKPAPVQVLCKTHLVYDVKELIATFVDDVRVRRLTSDDGAPEQFDWLTCDHMQLMFRDAAGEDSTPLAADHLQGPMVPASATTPRQSRQDALGISLDLEFERLSALGINQNLRLGSEENQLTAQMEQLFYDAAGKTVEMRHTQGDVEARYRNDILNCPFIRLQHADDDRVEAAECLGAGSVVRHDPETRQPQVEASWRESLTLKPDTDPALDVLEIVGNARLLQPQQRTGIVADTLRVWLDGEALQDSEGDLQTAFASAGESAELPLKRVQATSDVALVSPQLHLETQLLEAAFVAGSVPSPPTDDRDPMRRPSREADDDEPQPVVVAADAVNAQLIVDPSTEKTDVLQLHARDGVTISRASPAESPVDASAAPFSIEAEQVELRNQNGSHVLRLLGSPARIRHPEAEIEGDEMFFDRAGNLALVEGEGALFVLVDSDLQGEPLEVPEKLLVRWSEQMKFDGRQADFLGDIRATLDDDTMRCAQMKVGLSGRVSFTDDAARTRKLEINRIECLGEVVGQYREYERNAAKLIALRMVEVADFSFERDSGRIHARGPGTIKNWQLAGQRRRLRLEPASTEDVDTAGGDSPKWEYTRIKFSGKMTGNQHDRYVKLHERVRVMHGPVDQVLAVIDRDILDDPAADSSQASNSLWIGSDILEVRLVPGAGEGPETVSVLARGNAELQGKVMGARADSISFDEASEKFTLRGRGTEAYLWHQEHPGARRQWSTMQTIYFVPSRYEIKGAGVRGIQGSP